LLNSLGFTKWQVYRDEFLLQVESQQALLFDEEIVNCSKNSVNLICGKAHASTLIDINTLNWINADFAIDEDRRIIVCPYFDYRQLSNVKLNKLVGLIQDMNSL
jgi:hypothetical protein